LAKPIPSSESHVTFDIYFSRELFVANCAKFGFIFAWFAIGAVGVLRTLNFQLDRIGTYLMKRAVIGPDASVVAIIFKYGRRC
jgi:hypothetical protein